MAKYHDMVEEPVALTKPEGRILHKSARALCDGWFLRPTASRTFCGKVTARSRPISGA